MCWICEDWGIDREEIERLTALFTNPNGVGGIGYESPGTGEDAEDLPGDGI